MEMVNSEKMLRGELYLASDPQLTAEREAVRLLTGEFNSHVSYAETEKRKELSYKIFPNSGKNLHIEPPVFCDYGYNMKIGDNCFFNFNCVFLDVCPITIGNAVKFGPNVSLYAATHPLNAKVRASGLEYGEPIVIGDDAWIGGGCVILPGITIGKSAIVGAGSVVTKDVPDDAVVAGNAAEVIKMVDNSE
ncbi:putative acetyltransferase DDB_G0275913 [Convolutriloba macropyga]|uniref:putative acetyltransferase DDB_G0275913 n=1 Tax=Convolutriloba macropyga TaxID=536237 RepID=UPI003F52035C